MKEQELDKFLNKCVEITEYDGRIQKGYLYKIENGRTKINGREELNPINKGYFLVRFYDGGIAYRRSHIKKIKELKGENNE